MLDRQRGQAEQHGHEQQVPEQVRARRNEAAPRQAEGCSQKFFFQPTVTPPGSNPTESDDLRECAYQPMAVPIA